MLRGPKHKQGMQIQRDSLFIPVIIPTGRLKWVLKNRDKENEPNFENYEKMQTR
jgi:hypothetical protein